MNISLAITDIRKSGRHSLLPMSCLLLAVLSPAASRAQNPDSGETWKPVERIIVISDSGKAYTEDDVIDLALKRSRRIQSLSANVEIAEHRLASSGGMPNPELRIGNVSTRNYDEEFDEMQIGVRIRLPDLGEMGDKKEEARTDLCEQQVEKNRYIQDLSAKVRRDFADVVAWDRLTELAERKVSLLDRRIGMIEELIRTGDRSIVYYLKAKSMRAQAWNDFMRAAQRQGSARRQLVKRTDLALNTPLAEGLFPELPGELDTAIRIASLNRPETGFVKQEIEYAIKQRRFEWFKLVPWLNFIQFSYHREKTRARDWGEISAGIDIPLFNLNIGNIKATNLAVRKREARYEGVLETIEEEVCAAYSLYRDLWLDWKNFSVSSEKQISESEHVIAQSSVFETLRSDEVLELEMTVIETKQLLAEKKRDLAYALSELLFAMGVEKLDPVQ